MGMAKNTVTTNSRADRMQQQTLIYRVEVPTEEVSV